MSVCAEKNIAIVSTNNTGLELFYMQEAVEPLSLDFDIYNNVPDALSFISDEQHQAVLLGGLGLDSRIASRFNVSHSGLAVARFALLKGIHTAILTSHPSPEEIIADAISDEEVEYWGASTRLAIFDKMDGLDIVPKITKWLGHITVNG